MSGRTKYAKLSLMEENYLQWFNLRGGGMIAILFVIGVVIYLLKIDYLGIAFMVVAGALAIIHIIIELDDKAKKSRRGY